MEFFPSQLTSLLPKLAKIYLLVAPLALCTATGIGIALLLMCAEGSGRQLEWGAALVPRFGHATFAVQAGLLLATPGLAPALASPAGLRVAVAVLPEHFAFTHFSLTELSYFFLLMTHVVLLLTALAFRANALEQRASAEVPSQQLTQFADLSAGIQKPQWEESGQSAATFAKAGSARARRTAVLLFTVTLLVLQTLLQHLPISIPQSLQKFLNAAFHQCA